MCIRHCCLIPHTTELTRTSNRNVLFSSFLLATYLSGSGYIAACFVGMLWTAHRQVPFMEMALLGMWFFWCFVLNECKREMFFFILAFVWFRHQYVLKAWIKMEPDLYHCCNVAKSQFCAFCRIKQAHTKTSTPTLSRSWSPPCQNLASRHQKSWAWINYRLWR